MKREDLKIFTNIPVIRTERAVLRRLTPNDAEDVYSYSSDPLLTKYLLWYPHPDRSYTKEYLNYLSRMYKRGEYYDWGVELDGKIIGTAGFTRFDIDNNSAEIGYVIGRGHWGAGLATEMAKAVIRYGFEFLHLHRISARYILENEASRRVLKKCHMTEEGIHRDSLLCKGIYRSVGVFAITEDEYYDLIKKRAF